ncbi:nucleotidyltransferase domain-containing protein [Arenibaculum sp.]|jgi:predicted nucleotidyltransferase|uniref:nucleotidyltransferase family protein n=1 Tax=Arenibaculum sp. TaxID=2865862 RepID=UPI002E130D45|nr:nucleotidyltransferase domain-containing protein [Arenibaculum sp.]
MLGSNRNEIAGMPTSSYPRFDELRASRLAERRDAAVRAVRQAALLAERVGGRLVVFGSLAEGGFHERSDVDLALLAVPPGRDLDMAAEIEAALAGAGFVAEVVPERFMSPSLRRRVEEHGREPGVLG